MTAVDRRKAKNVYATVAWTLYMPVDGALYGRDLLQPAGGQEPLPIYVLGSRVPQNLSNDRVQALTRQNWAIKILHCSTESKSSSKERAYGKCLWK